MRASFGILVAILLGLVGCNLEVTDSKDSNGKDAVKIQVPGLSIDTSSGKGVELPADFPKDVKVPADAKLIGMSNLPGAGVFTYEIKSATAQAILEQVQSEMLAEGWEVKVASIDNGALSLTKDKRVAQYTVSDRDGKKFLVINLLG